jgi:excisionase family DNA binding protein
MAKLSDLLSDPGKIEGLSREAIPRLRGELAQLDTLLLSRLFAAKEPDTPEDQLLNVTEAAERLGVSTDYLYHHSATMPFTRRVGRKLLFSTAGLAKYIRSR